MTIWLPDLRSGHGPLYLRLADQIEHDIAAGILKAGDKLPPQRNLAFDLGVTIGTVGRAYALVRERGLVAGEVGRGTYVRPPLQGDADDLDTMPEAAAYPFPGGVVPAKPDMGGTRVVSPRPGVILLDSTAAPEVGQAETIGTITAQIVADCPHQIASYTRIVPPLWREAGQTWLAHGGWEPDGDSIVPTTGVHAAIMAIVAAVTGPGDRILFEGLTYSSFARSATLIGRRPIAVRCDNEGAVPEDLERVCAQQHPKLLFLMPDMHNPTLGQMSPARRADVAEIARRHNLWLIEDAIYGALVEERETPLAALAPDRTFHVSGLSKSVAAGVRGGWIACPPGHAHRIHIKHKMVTGGWSFLLTEIAARLVMSGAADTIRAAARREIEARRALAVKAFAGNDFRTRPNAPFLWLKLPDPWLSGQFRQVAASEGVLVDDEDEFKPNRTQELHHRVRIAFTTPAERDTVAAGFQILRRLLDTGVTVYDSYT